MAYDVSRLLATLNSSGLQQKDNNLYQVIFQLIRALGNLQTVVSSASSSSSGSTVNEVNNIFQILGDGSGGGDSDGMVIPGERGITGATGATGAQGAIGPVVLVEDGIDGLDGMSIPVPGPTGGDGPTGPQGPMGAILFLDDFVEPDVMPIPGRDGTAGNSGGLVYLGSQVASASAVLDFTSLISATYNKYVFEFENILPATDNVDLLMRTSTDNGATFDAAAGDYRYAEFVNNTGSFSTDDVCSASATFIIIAPTMDSGSTTGGINGTLSLYNPLNAAQYKAVSFQVSGFLNDNQFYNIQGSGWRISTSDVDAVRFLMSSGNIASGTIRMYGLIKS